LRYHAETELHPKLSIVNLTFPSTPQAIIQQFKDHLESLPKSPNHKIVAVIDSISSNPGMALPWEEMTRIARGMGIWTLIDGAHTVGQLPLDVKKADPDFLVSVSHKHNIQMSPTVHL
jgi:selenocysteine lyase/cysteine desulfurase